MKHPALDPSNWEAVPLRQQIDRMQDLLASKPGNERKTAGRKFINDGQLLPLKLYTYLRTRFGPPNGFMMLTRNDSVDNLIHWHYELKSGRVHLSFVGLAFRTEIVILGGPSLPLDAWDLFVSALGDHMKELEQQLSATQKTFERWSLFVNQYKRVAKVVESYAAKLRACNLESIELPERPQTQQDSAKYSAKLTEAWDTYKEASEYGLVLRMLSPVMGEAFVNFLITLLALPVIRDDKRLLEDLYRKQIDVRIKTLHLNCRGFAEAVDQNARPFKDFLRVMKKRNDFLHGNVDPKLTHIEYIYFDQRTIPLLAAERSLAEFALGNAIAHVEPTTVLSDLAVVEAFVEYLLSCLEEHYQQEVRLLASEEHLGYDIDRKIFRGILPPAYVEMHTFPEDPSAPQDSAKTASEP